MFNRIEIDLPVPNAVNTPKGRFYETPEGNRYPSVTTLMSYKSRESIAAWREKVGEEEANKISNQSATRGTKIHDLAEKYLLNEDLNTDNLSLLDMQMWKNLKSEIHDIDNIHAIEDPLFSDYLRLAGRVDCIAEYKGVLSVIDFKTARKPKRKEWIDGYFMQCSAYAIMFEEMTKIPVAQTVVMMTVEGDDPQVFVEKRDNYADQLLDLRLDYERHYRLEG
jgi:genome maintenance exonuclease 1